MKTKIFAERLNVPCSYDFKRMIEEQAIKEGEHMTTIARRWLKIGARLEREVVDG